jgi:hypothetical protein
MATPDIPGRFAVGARVIRSSGPDMEDKMETTVSRIINRRMLVTADYAQYYADSDSEENGILHGYHAFRAYPAILQLAPDQ